MADQDIRGYVIASSIIFIIAPIFVVIYIFIYNNRKKRHKDEKEEMKLNFETEIARTQLEVQEQTMQTIGADLHDNIGQLLSLTALTLNSISYEDEIKVKQKVDSAIGLTFKSMEEMRLLGKLLQGEQLIGNGLEPAISQELKWLEKAGGLAIVYQVEGDRPVKNNPDKDLVLFRILQESLNNVMKHARASHLTIKLSYTALSVGLQVTDDGAGFDLGAAITQAGGMGLQNIRNRARLIGGDALMKSGPGFGTQIDIFIPYP